MMTKRYDGFCTGIDAAKSMAEKILKRDGQQIRMIFGNGYACLERKNGIVSVIE